MPSARYSLIILVLASGAEGHGRMLEPKPRPPLWRDSAMTGFTSAVSAHRENEPPYTLAGPTTFSGHTYTHSAYRCHDFAETTPTTTLTAGSELSVSWTLPANHPGDCALYVSYDEPTAGFSAGSDSSTWFKIWDFQGCVSAQTLRDGFDGIDPPKDNYDTITLPSWLPSASHAVLRWEWITVHSVTDSMEFFVSCADVIIDGTQESPAAALAKLSPVVSISGLEHLPPARSDYRQAYDREFGPEFIASKPVATYGGTVAPSPSAAPTSAPSQSPVASPTSAPSPSPVASPTAAPSPSPSAAECLPKWAACVSEGEASGDCCSPNACYQEHQWYSQCLSSCPAGWACDESGSAPPPQASPRPPAPSPVEQLASPAPSPPEARYPPPSPPPASTASCIATWSSCSVNGDGGECCGSNDCYAEHQWYSQCRPSCPTGWACDWACSAAA